MVEFDGLDYPTIEFDDDTAIALVCDEEGNGPGWFETLSRE